MSIPPSEGGPALPLSLHSRNPFRWLTVFGPGAVIASLTIGSGELIFSSRAGALFGYRLLWFFLLVLFAKWVLVYATARQMVLTGGHPFQRWMDLPGPRGWLPLVFFLLALAAFPVWVGFHAGTLGTLLSWAAGTESSLRGGAHFVWGMGILGLVLVFVLAGGYKTLERVQLLIVVLMLLCVLIAVMLVRPDWFEFFHGLFIPQPVHYPAWALANKEFTQRPVWLETITYVGVLGGSGYDYLAYVSYLREKHWGRAGETVASLAELNRGAADQSDPTPLWLRAVLADSILSFAAILIFTAVFTICGAVILGPQHLVPGGANLLTLQAGFVTPIYPWLKYVYFVGAFLAIFGTLYGTIEVAPVVLREFLLANDGDETKARSAFARKISVLWVSCGGWIVLLGSFIYTWLGQGQTPPGLISILTPANLFTGVLSCGFICLLAEWSDRSDLPPAWRMNAPLRFANVLAGIIFLALGLKAYWDQSGWRSWLILLGTVAVGWIASGLRAGRDGKRALSAPTRGQG